jgi:O-antigen/teichoic acid export membrane protein
MKQHLTNATYGVLDYVSYPVTMLLVAPIVIRKLGPSEYGLWILAASVISAGGILASGFCDAAMQRIAKLRGQDRIADATRTFRVLLTINLVLGSVLAAIVWFATPSMATHLAASRVTPFRESAYSLRLSGGAILLRALESAAVITHRAFEQYRGTVQISAMSRLLTLACAGALATAGYRVVAILIATLAVLMLSVCLQFSGLHHHFGRVKLGPAYDRAEALSLLRPGVFVWLQSVCGVAFGQLDRILLAVSFGTVALAPYAVCVQFAQPIFGLSASGLHFIFPLISRRAVSSTPASLRHLLGKAAGCNLLIVALASVTLLAFGNTAIHMWSGGAIDPRALAILPGIVLSTAFMGLGVTGTYAMQALGRFRTVALISVGGRISALLLLFYLLGRFGIRGVVIARVCYGATALLVYIPLLRRLWPSTPRAAETVFATYEMSGEKP